MKVGEHSAVSILPKVSREVSDALSRYEDLDLNVWYSDVVNNMGLVNDFKLTNSVFRAVALNAWEIKK